MLFIARGGARGSYDNVVDLFNRLGPRAATAAEA
jgi:hypothetical protein